MILIALAAPLFLNLNCPGQASNAAVVSSTNTQVSATGGLDVSGSANSSTALAVPLSVKLRVEGETARIYISNLGRWLPVKKLSITDDEITGRVQTTFLASSGFRVDRLSGEMTSEGGFKGACAVEDLTTRKF